MYLLFSSVNLSNLWREINSYLKVRLRCSNISTSFGICVLSRPCDKEIRLCTSRNNFEPWIFRFELLNKIKSSKHPTHAFFVWSEQFWRKFFLSSLMKFECSLQSSTLTGEQITEEQGRTILSWCTRIKGGVVPQIAFPWKDDFLTVKSAQPILVKSTNFWRLIVCLFINCRYFRSFHSSNLVFFFLIESSFTLYMNRAAWRHILYRKLFSHRMIFKAKGRSQFRLN